VKKGILVSILMLVVFSIFAQATGAFTPTSNASAYSFEGSRNGVEKLKINTYIWGQVAKPGLYIVPDDTDLLTLLSLAGGPREDAKLTKIRIVRPTAQGEKIIWINMKKYLESGDEQMIPVMQPGDTVIVAGTIFYAFSRMTDFLSKTAIALSLYTTLVNLK
jgi:hypothetical protein